MINTNLTDILTQIQTFYRPKRAKKSVLQTQVRKCRPTKEPCYYLFTLPGHAFPELSPRSPGSVYNDAGISQ